MFPRLVLMTATVTLLSANAQAEVCRLVDGREFSTNYMGDITYPTELVGFRLRERDDLQGFEIIRLWSSSHEVYLVESCHPGNDRGDGWGTDPVAARKNGGRNGGRNGPKGPRDEQDGGRDSGGNCDNNGDQNSSSCADL